MRRRQAKKIFKRCEQFWLYYAELSQRFIPQCYKLQTVDNAVLKITKTRRRFARAPLISFSTVLLFLLFPSICLAQATAIIDGPTEAAPGDLIILDASQSDCDARVWLLVGSDKSFLQFEEGKKCVFASGASGQYHFVLSTAKVTDSVASVATAKFTVTIGCSPQPKPGPTPEPKPDPKPPQPEVELTGLAKQAFDAAQNLERKPGECSRVAGIYETAASKALALSWTMQELHAEAKKAAFPDAATAARWKPFNVFLASAMAGKTTVADAAAALSDIAKGLSAAELSTDPPRTQQADGPNETLKESVEKIRQSLQGIRQEVGQ